MAVMNIYVYWDIKWYSVGGGGENFFIPFLRSSSSSGFVFVAVIVVAFDGDVDEEEILEVVAESAAMGGEILFDSSFA
eukprot:5060011-Ditylum_brightwellii.AAC.1